VKEGESRNRSKRKQKKTAATAEESVSGVDATGNHNSYLDDMWQLNNLDDLDWTLCDKDCGWCGHCYEDAGFPEA
jgi:hypothetical protein